MLLAGCMSPEDRAAAYLSEAQAFYEAGELVYAKVEARNALQIEPKNAEARYLLALINEEEEDFREAIGNLIIAVEAAPDFLEARVMLGRFFVMGRQIEEAKEQADAAMALDPDDAGVRLLNAQATYLEGDAEEALVQANRALAIDPTRRQAVTFVAALLTAAGREDEALEVIEQGIGNATGDDIEELRRARLEIYRRQGDIETIESQLERLVEDFPESPSYGLALMRLYAEQGRVEDVEARIRDLIARDPDNAEWRIQLARLQLSIDKADDAEASLREAIDENPESGTMRLALAGFFEVNQRHEDALAQYQEIAEADPVSAEGLAARNRISLLYLAADDGKAREVNAAILREVPNNVDALLSRAAFSMGDEQFDEAIADLRSALVKQPDSPRGMLMLARAYLLNGDLELAEDAYRKLVEFDSTNRAARNELASLIGNRGDAEQAAMLLRDTLQMAPGDIGASRNLVKALLVEQDFEAAADEAKRMIELGEDSGAADYQLGLALQAQGDTDGAIAAYKDALDRNPGADQALTNLTELLIQRGSSEEAEMFLQRQIELHPELTKARLLLGEIYRVDGRLAQARSMFTDVIAARPEATAAYIHLASTFAAGSDEQLAVLADGLRANPGDAGLGLALGSGYKQLEKFEQSIEVYESIIKINGGNDAIVTNLAALLLDERTDADSYARALELTSRFESGASHPFNLAMLGWAYYRNGQSAAAVRQLERAVAAIGENPKLRYYLGMAYLQNGDRVGARRELGLAVTQADDAGGTFDGYAEAVATLESLRNKNG